jgi:hypothetical protein
VGAGQVDTEKIKELERRIAELKQSLPAHSVKPEMLIELEELEEKLEEAKRKYDECQ